MGKIELSNDLIKELKDIQESLNKWTSLEMSMDSVVKTIIQWYYLAINYPITQWNKGIKGDMGEILKMKFFITYGRYPKTKKEMKNFLEGLSVKKGKD
jgi:hypothetical protein